ncbi:MAG: hypothetical protein H7Y11_10070 [Armatimonadetes bacterium]|nr:hypothetical protein [Anaerolineae bacterium]
MNTQNPAMAESPAPASVNIPKPTWWRMMPWGLILAITIAMIALVVAVYPRVYQPTGIVSPIVHGDYQVTELAARVEIALRSTEGILSIIQFIGAIVTVVGVLAAVVGLRNYFDLQTKLGTQIAAIDSKMGALDTLRQQTDDELVEIRALRIEVSNRIEELNLQVRAAGEYTAKLAQAQAFTQLAQQQLSMGNVENAQKTLLEALKLDERNFVVLYFLGDVCLRLRKPDDGTAYLERAFALYQDFPQARLTYAYAQRILGDRATNANLQAQYYGEALKVFSTLAQDKSHYTLLDASGESAFGAYASLLRQMGNIDAAIEWYGIAHEATPQNSYPLLNLAILSFLKQQPEDAKKHAKKCHKLAKRRVEANQWDYWACFDLTMSALILDELPAIQVDLLKNALDVVPDGLIDPIIKLRGGLERLEQGLRACGRPTDSVTVALTRVNEEYKQRMPSVSPLS